MEQKVIWSHCRKCKQDTRHIILNLKHVDSDDEGYRCATKYFTLECCGCQNISFRVEFHDYEAHYQTGPDEWEHDISVEIYPHFIKGHNAIENTVDIPSIVYNIYSESMRAVQEEAYTLAGLGLRACIESVCNDKGIKGRSLQNRIDNMAKEGFISKLDAERLHAIRFMGNDAAHDIKKAAKESVLVALRIVDHLILTVYVFEGQVNKHLDKPISNLDKLIIVLKNKLPVLTENDSISLTKWLGNDRRRIIDNYQQLEKELIDYIKNNNFEEVELSGEIGGLDGVKVQGFRKKTLAEGW
jgi:hypothetical protein